MLLPFDAHNHVHMGPTPPVLSLLAARDTRTTTITAAPVDEKAPANKAAAAVSGMAIMSTHPRDYDRVLHLSKSLPSAIQGDIRVVPCFGVHPWFLHELSDSDWEPMIQAEEDKQDQSTTSTSTNLPRWIQDLETLVRANPNAIVGEIGLDGFHFDPNTEDLVSPMTHQVDAFRLQMELAARLQRPVSVHTVQCFGPLFDILNQIKKDAKKKSKEQKQLQQRESKAPAAAAGAALPPTIYFHAFGGKPATVDQILALCKPAQVYFGFAPIVNFRSPKTVNVVRKVGIERLVLETDHEDAARVPHSMEECIQYLATALDMEKKDVIEQTTKNAFALYNLNLN